MGKVAIFVGRMEQDNARRRRQGVIDEILGRDRDPDRFDPASGEIVGNGFTVVGTYTDQVDVAKAKANVEDVLTRQLDFIDLVAVYGVRLPGLEAEIPVAALTLRSKAELDPRRLREVVETRLGAAQRPLVVRVCDALPMTAGHRTRKRSLREQGLFAEGDTLWLAPDAPSYVPLERSEEDRLHAAAGG